jgi:hypothetical protein
VDESVGGKGSDLTAEEIATHDASLAAHQVWRAIRELEYMCNLHTEMNRKVDKTRMDKKSFL